MQKRKTAPWPSDQPWWREKDHTSSEPEGIYRVAPGGASAIVGDTPMMEVQRSYD